MMTATFSRLDFQHGWVDLNIRPGCGSETVNSNHTCKKPNSISNCWISNHSSPHALYRRSLSYCTGVNFCVVYSTTALDPGCPLSRITAALRHLTSHNFSTWLFNSNELWVHTGDNQWWLQLAHWGLTNDIAWLDGSKYRANCGSETCQLLWDVGIWVLWSMTLPSTAKFPLLN